MMAPLLSRCQPVTPHPVWGSMQRSLASNGGQSDSVVDTVPFGHSQSTRGQYHDSISGPLISATSSTGEQPVLLDAREMGGETRRTSDGLSD